MTERAIAACRVTPLIEETAMGSTTALFTGLSGLNANARRLEVIGNNIANVNTTAFKSNRMLFSTTFARNYNLGSQPAETSGGTNPFQVGLGVNVAGTQRNFANGAVGATGIPTDMALEGDGMFIVKRGSQQLFTRSGAFQLNSRNDLVTVTGERVQGYGVDDRFNIVAGRVQDMNIPLGVLKLAEATRNVNFSGNLNADGTVATAGTSLVFGALRVGGSGATLTTPLTGLDGTPFADGDRITIDGAQRGGKTVPVRTFTVTATTTVGDFMSFLQNTLGVVPNGGRSSGDPTPSTEPGGFAIDTNGVVTFTGNWGSMNDLKLVAGDIRVTDSGGVAKANPFTITKAQAATGESVRTGFVVYDSLGTPRNVDLTMVLSAKDSTGTHWRAFLHSADDTDGLHLEDGARGGTGFVELVPLLSFNTQGRLTSTPSIPMSLDLSQEGVIDPLNVTLNLGQGADTVTAFSNTGGSSQIAAVSQDGAALGTLSSFAVNDNGVITGGFTNGLTRTIGQVVIARFTNAAGLVDAGNNLFSVGPNSGEAVITVPTEFGTGRVVGGALEGSNVDLSQEFINMILTSTGYSASSRVITTTDQLIQQLLALAR
ncbi:MAG: flagellar hook-basal body complex protein [Phycisphaerales bacterium]|nr:flagellar hook-basal body complex protein [Phycisphaerales bacterium]